MIIRYIYFYAHNSKIDWWKKIWEHTRYLNIYTNKAKIKVLGTKIDSLEFKDNIESVFLKYLLLDKIELEDYENLSITLLNHSDEDQKTIAQVIAEIFDKKSVEKVFDDNENTLN